MKRGVSVVVLALASIASSAHAQSGPDFVHAKEAYDRGVAAHAKGDYSRAAREFAAADAFAPSPVALQAALEEAVDANDPITGAELLERSKRIQPPVPSKLAQSIELARKKLGGRAGRLRVDCATTCTGTLDGRSFDPRTATWVLAGARTIVLTIEGETDTRVVDVRADDTTEVTIASKKRAIPVIPPPPPPSELRPPPTPPIDRADKPPPAPSGISPIVFVVGAGATVVAGAVTTYLLIRTKSKHDDFNAADCEAAPNAGCTALSNDGAEAERNANVGIVVTAVLGVATILVGAFFTDWQGESRSAFTGNGYVLRF